MADLDNKIVAIQTMQNMASKFQELDDAAAAMQKLISSRGWNTTGAPTDAELAPLGIKAANVNQFITLLTQYNRLMNNQTVTQLTGRTFADAIRSL